MLTQKEARKYFDYDAESGELTRRVSLSRRALVGAKVGSPDGKGYLQVRIDYKLYLVHRLIWLWVHGYFPEHNIDHINRVRNDNRLENLREASKSCNARNAKQQTNNTSGVTGVCWHKLTGKWITQIKINNRNYNLGYFKDFTEAVLRRLAAEQCLGWEGCDSSSDAFKYLLETRHGQRKTD